MNPILKPGVARGHHGKASSSPEDIAGKWCNNSSNSSTTSTCIDLYVILCNSHVLILVHAYTMIAVHTCTTIIIHACTMIILHACPMIRVHANTLIIIRACTMIKISPPQGIQCLKETLPKALRKHAIQNLASANYWKQQKHALKSSRRSPRGFQGPMETHNAQISLTALQSITLAWKRSECPAYSDQFKTKPLQRTLGPKHMKIAAIANPWTKQSS